MNTSQLTNRRNLPEEEEEKKDAGVNEEQGMLQDSLDVVITAMILAINHAIALNNLPAMAKLDTLSRIAPTMS